MAGEMASATDRDNRALARELLACAREHGVTIGCAESCTGGMIAAEITGVAGSSDCFVGGVVSYWVNVKESVLGVDASEVDEYGVVSEQVARAMASGARELLSCDYAVATTGIAGPGGAQPGKPVGTVCYAVATPEETTSFTTCQGSARDEVRKIAVGHALMALLAKISVTS